MRINVDWSVEEDESHTPQEREAGADGSDHTSVLQTNLAKRNECVAAAAADFQGATNDVNMNL